MTNYELRNAKATMWSAWFAVIGVLLNIAVGSIDAGRVDSWLDRAQSAGSPEQVVEYLSSYKTELVDKRYDDMYMSTFRYPASSVKIYIDVLDGLIDRAYILSTQDPRTDVYQMGLINLETDLNDLEPGASIAYMRDWTTVVIVILDVITFCFAIYVSWVVTEESKGNKDD